MRSGVVNISVTTGIFRHAGIFGNWWSSRASSDTGVYNFYTHDSELNASYPSANRWYAFPLRCLSTVLDIWRCAIIIDMEEIQRQLEQIIGRLFDAEVTTELTVAPEATGADYASNIAMRLAKIAHKAPMMIAEEIKAELEKSESGYVVAVAAPGFLNFSLKNDYFEQKIAAYAQNEIISPDEYCNKTVVTEFSDPNPFKVLHVGHLYTSIVGDSISRLLELAGAKVVRANFGGDVGLHVGKTIWALLQKNYSPDDITIEKIGQCYVEGTQSYEDDEAAKDEIVRLNKAIYALAELGQDRSLERLELEKLAEDYDFSTAKMAQIAALYWQGRELSYQYFADFYATIGLKFDKYYPESTVAGRGLAEVKAHVGTTYDESDGAIVYRGEKVGLHTRVFINREGVPTYEAKDVGLIFTKWDDWHFDESVVITGNEQSDYMKVVLASVHEYASELVDRTQHLTHGMVKLPGNVKMSSRKGNFLKAVDVIDLVGHHLAESQPSDGSTRLLTLAAIKYAFLKYRMGGDIVFDPKESVSTSGNSGVYLLYSAVRAKKILQKTASGVVNKKFVQNEGYAITEGSIRKLNRKIVQYDEVIRGAVQEKAPYKVCNYLYELAQEFSRFYEHVPVAGSAEEDKRKLVVQAYLNVMTHGLGLLGIEIPEEM